MKYISYSTLLKAIAHLNGIDIFYISSFLVFKRERIGVGELSEVPVTFLDKNFFDEHYRIIPESQHYFRLSITSQKSKIWLEPKFPEGGLQKTRSTKFKNALIHPPKSNKWAWSTNYLDVLRNNLPKNKKIDLLSIACWIYKYEDFDNYIESGYIVGRFLSDFNISKQEYDALFTDDRWDIEFSDHPVSWSDFSADYGMPPDIEETVIFNNISFMSLGGIGNIANLEIAPSDRLNLFFGENSAGKTLLLDSIFWMFSGRWPSFEILPNQQANYKSWMKWIYQGSLGRKEIIASPEKLGSIWVWKTNIEYRAVDATILYIRSDGNIVMFNKETSIDINSRSLLEGIRETNRFGKQVTLFSGLYADISSWNRRSHSNLSEMNQILDRLSPYEKLEGQKEYSKHGISIKFDRVDGVVVKTKFGEIPLHQVSSGMRKVVTLAYMMTLIKGSLKKIIIIDEIENHLHPVWQRTYLPAILDIVSTDESYQIFASTHSNIIVGSIENYFQNEIDSLYLFSPTSKNIFGDLEISVTSIEMLKQGKFSGWLTYEVFGLQTERPLETEMAIERAKKVFKKHNPSIQQITDVGKELRRYLPPQDEFWPMWLYFESKNGIGNA